MNNEENINKKLLDDLKNLPKVNTPKNFETELWRKINSSEEVKKESFWDKIFSPGKIAPAAVALVSAVIIFFVVDVNSEEMEDPLNIAPRLREDVAVYQTFDEVKEIVNEKPETKKQKVREDKSETVNEDDKGLRELEKSSAPEPFTETGAEIKDQEINEGLIVDKFDSDSNKRQEESVNLGGSVAPILVPTQSSEINKNNLNFMQRNLSVQEKVEVQQLKMKVESQKSSKTDENQAKSTQK